MNPFKTALAVTTALVASTSLSRAGVVTVTASHAAATNWGTSTQTSGYSPTFNLSVPGFNTSLGNLTSVVVTISSVANGAITLKNNHPVGTGSTTNVSGFLIDINQDMLPGAVAKTISLTTSAVTDGALVGQGTYGPQTVSKSGSTSKTYLSSLSQFDSTWSILAGDFGSVDVTSGNGNGSATYTDTRYGQC